MIILLAVVNKVEGTADTLTGEQFELGPDSLCIAVETNKDRKLNVHQPKSVKYIHRQLFYPVFTVSLMAESSSNNPDLTRALQTVAQNLLPPVFQVGDSTQPR